MRVEDGVITVDADALCADVEAAVAPWLFASDRPDETVRAWIDRGGGDLLWEWLGPTRAQVLGIDVAGGMRFGGRVVKNVAGYDLARAFVGARGALGRIERVHLRARPAPRGWRAARRDGIDELDELDGGDGGDGGDPGCVIHADGATWRFLRNGEVTPPGYEEWDPREARAALRGPWAAVQSFAPLGADGVVLAGPRVVGVTSPPAPRDDPLWDRLVGALAP